MTRLFQTGFESGPNGGFGGGGYQCGPDLQGWSTVAPYIGSTRGPWSAYAALPSPAPVQSMPPGGGGLSEFYSGGGWAYYGGLPSGVGPQIFTAGWGGFGTGDPVMHVVQYNGGYIAAYRGNNIGGQPETQLGYSSGIVLYPSRWHYIEVHMVCSNSVGVIEVRVDGITVLNLTGQDTDDATPSGKWDRLRFGADNNVALDDWYINDTTDNGHGSTGFDGDQRVSALTISGAGDHTGLTPSTGSNYACVDEIPGSDTDYVSSSTVDAYDLYALNNTSGIGNVYGVSVHARAWKADAGVGEVAIGVKTQSTESWDSDIPLSTQASYYHRHMDGDPNGGNWDASKLDAMQIGAKVR